MGFSPDQKKVYIYIYIQYHTVYIIVNEHLELSWFPPAFSPSHRKYVAKRGCSRHAWHHRGSSGGKRSCCSRAAGGTHAMQRLSHKSNFFEVPSQLKKEKIKNAAVTDMVRYAIMYTCMRIYIYISVRVCVCVCYQYVPYILIS